MLYQHSPIFGATLSRGSSPGCGTARFAPFIPGMADGMAICDRELLCESLSSARPEAGLGIWVPGGRRRLPSLEARRSYGALVPEG